MFVRAPSESVDEREALVDRLVGFASVELPFGNGGELDDRWSLVDDRWSLVDRESETAVRIFSRELLRALSSRRRTICSFLKDQAAR